MTSTRGALDSDLDDDLDLLVDSDELRDALHDAELRSKLLSELVVRRKALGLKQREVAERMETGQSTVSEFETGESDPFFSTLQRYARAVDACIAVQVSTPERASITAIEAARTATRSEYRRRSMRLVSERPKVYRGSSSFAGGALRAANSTGKILQYEPRKRAVS